MHEELARIAILAGHEILKFYQKNLHSELKSDGSPVSEADQRASEIIQRELKKSFPGINIVDEENLATNSISLASREFFLVDPLDGTKEFLQGRKEFTVNIALIQNGKPIVGAVFLPAAEKAYFASENQGAHCQVQQEQRRLQIAASPNLLRVVCSRSHQTPQEQVWLEQLKPHFAKMEILALGSSVKILAVAEGLADFYPRGGPTCEWDIAAAHCILKEAGGRLLDVQTRQEMSYNKPQFKNSSFWALRPDLLALLQSS